MEAGETVATREKNRILGGKYLVELLNVLDSSQCEYQDFLLSARIYASSQVNRGEIGHNFTHSSIHANGRNRALMALDRLKQPERREKESSWGNHFLT
jgi:hypothetical protein